MIVIAGVACGLARAGQPPEFAARLPETRSADGKYAVSLRRADAAASPWDKTDFAVTLEFDFYEVGAERFQQPVYYLDNVSPFRGAVTAEGRAIGEKTLHFGYTSNDHARTVTVSNVVLGPETSGLASLDLEVPVIRVTEWRTLRFENLGRGKSGYLHCGPFDLATEGDDKRFTVAAGAFSEFEKEHRDYLRHVPLQFLHHQYALEAIHLVDADGREANSLGGSLGGGGGVFTYQWPDERPALNANDNAPKLFVFGEPRPIAYPVTITLRMPEKWTTEQVKFRVKKVPIPTLTEARREYTPR